MTKTKKEPGFAAQFILNTSTDITDIKVIHRIEKDLDKCLKAYGLVRTGTEKSDVVKILFRRVAYPL
jgi:hypothetical protein